MSRSILDLRLAMVLAPAALMIPAALWYGPIAQDPGYHALADQRLWLGIPHPGDVLTNLGFILAGAYGLYVVFSRALAETAAWTAFFAGVLATGLGSTWYHLAPDNAGLLWDRLPMTVAFMSLTAILVGERIDARATRLLLWPLVLLGLVSVLWWGWTETLGRGDLRLYALVQFYPMLGLPLILVLYPGRHTGGHFYWLLIASYGLAKLAEYLDAPLYDRCGVLSGHGIKHLLAALGAVFSAEMLRRRRTR
ncbi:MAG: ceramidase domain-containing protein [Gammaproteobacteria bacterium]